LAIDHAIEVLKRFEGAVEVNITTTGNVLDKDNNDIKYECLYAIPSTDIISQTDQSDWDWDIRFWVYSNEYVYDKHTNKRLISDLRAEFDNKIYNNEIKLYDIPEENK